MNSLLLVPTNCPEKPLPVRQIADLFGLCMAVDPSTRLEETAAIDAGMRGDWYAP